MIWALLGQKRRIFFLKNYPLTLQKLFLKIQRVPPLDVEFESSFYQSHVIAFGLTIPKWYNTCIENIFRKYFFKKLEKIFWKIFLTKYLVLYHFGIVRPIAITWL